MLSKFVKTAALAALIGVGSMAAATVPAAAGGGGFTIQFGTGYGPGWGWGPGWGPGYGKGYGPKPNICKPKRAVNKARNMGVRKTRIVRRNPNRVVVKGWRHGYPVRVVFANRRHCPVIALR